MDLYKWSKSNKPPEVIHKAGDATYKAMKKVKDYFSGGEPKNKMVAPTKKKKKKNKGYVTKEELAANRKRYMDSKKA